MSGKNFEPDKKMIVATDIGEPDLVFHDVREDPFEIYGLYNPKNEDVFKRMPDEAARATSEGVTHLYKCTAGGRVRFSTDSSCVAIKCIMPRITRYDHMPLTGTSGFDMFEDYDGGSRYTYLFRPRYSMTDGYESIVRFPDCKKRYFTINFPTYNPVDRLYIGLKKDAVTEGGRKYRSKLPVVYYGSSITQGACSSRPGNAYQSIISRRTDLDFINLGFSGSGKGEDAITEYMAGLDMLAFVSDYDHNAPSAEHLRATHCKLYKTIREKHPDIPYIMVSKPDFDCDSEKDAERRDVIIDTFRYARANGDKNVWFIDGEGLFRGPDRDLCLVDDSHPSDVGFMKMADAIGRVLIRSLRDADFGE